MFCSFSCICWISQLLSALRISEEKSSLSWSVKTVSWGNKTKPCQGKHWLLKEMCSLYMPFSSHWNHFSKIGLAMKLRRSPQVLTRMFELWQDLLHVTTSTDRPHRDNFWLASTFWSGGGVSLSGGASPSDTATPRDKKHGFTRNWNKQIPPCHAILS